MVYPSVLYKIAILLYFYMRLYVGIDTSVHRINLSLLFIISLLNIGVNCVIGRQRAGSMINSPSSVKTGLAPINIRDDSIF